MRFNNFTYNYSFKTFFISSFFVSNIIFSQNEGITNKSIETKFESSNLPLLFIDTQGQAIDDEIRIIAHLGIIDNGLGNRNSTTDKFNNYDGLIAIELRGSSSSAYPKPQFRFETQDSLGENSNISLCGLPNENDWVLYGPYNDKSLIRNVFSYNLSNKLGRYASRTVFCEIFLNSEYIGLYVLMETVKRDNDRVNISKLTELENSGDELTGGYIVKIDKLDGENVDYWFSNAWTPFQYHYPKADEITELQKDYIANYFNSFEELMNSENYNNSENGYTNFIDVDSFVDHFILNEFCKNVDAYRLSAYLYKDKNSVNPKLFAGPIWDFNLTFGDAWIQDEINVSTDWQVDYSEIHSSDPFKVPFWWSKLSRDTDFINKVRFRWFELRETLFSYDSLFTQIDKQVDYIAESIVRNFERWPGVLTIPYDQEILRIKGWIIRRLNWIDNNIDKLNSINNISTNNFRSNFELHQNYPNPFNPTTVISYKVPTSIKSELADVKIVIYDILGRKVSTIVNEKQKPGFYQVKWNSENFPSGTYFYQMHVVSTFNSTLYLRSRKMILLK